MKKPRLATLWLDGCSGCHMSLLDLDEMLFSIAQKAELVYGPLVDVQEYPHDVDVAIVEGAVSSQDDLEKIRMSASARASWWRSATAPSPAMSRACATTSR